MSLALKVQKFIHYGNEFPFYVDGAVRLTIPDNLLKADEAKVLTRSECVQVLDVIKKAVVRVKSLARIDETLVLVVFILRHLADPDLRSLVYEALCEILTNFNDLTLFLMYRSRLGVPSPPPSTTTTTTNDDAGANGENTPSKTHFSSGLKSFLQKWYDKQTLEQLTEMIGEHRKLNGWRHRDIVSLAHIKFADAAKKKVIDVAFQRGSKFVADSTGNEDETVQKLVDICRVRMSEDPTEVSELVSKHKLRFEHLPSALYKTPEIWEKCLPVLSYSALLNCLHILQDLNLLTPQQGLAKKVGFAIGNPKTLKEAKLHPFKLYTELQLYENNERYTENVHEQHRAKKVAKLKITPNKEIVKKLRTAFEQSFDHYPATGARLIITLDNRHAMYTKKVLSKNVSKHISCFEASLIIALTYLKRERDVKILTYTDDEGTDGGIEVLPLQKSMSFEDALQFCKTRQRDKTLSSLELPWNFAKTKGMKADVFMTITDSIIRNAPLAKPPTQAISAYKKAVNMSNVRHVLIGLANPKRTFETLGPEEGRILEVAGFTSNTAKVVDEFIKGTL
ncbi:RNA-binding protein RO60-like [Culicoides brevitarsis]|uniref:RNA-binding protein RO60-like n=1 Tax=Culicoides brevitarsis TaxID=469753 RepID=UPI00307C4E09